MKKVPLRFVMLGPPASGKGTQGRKLAEHLGAEYLSTGAQLRREVASGSELGKQADVYLSNNDYVPDSLAVLLVESWLQTHQGSWVLDGFPRRLSQAEFLCSEPEFSENLQAIHLKVPVEELRRRVAGRQECTICHRSLGLEPTVCPDCGGELMERHDDTDEGFESRYQWFESETFPVLDYFASRDMLIEVDGKGSVDEVWARIEKEIF